MYAFLYLILSSFLYSIPFFPCNSTIQVVSPPALYPAGFSSFLSLISSSSSFLDTFFLPFFSLFHFSIASYLPLILVVVSQLLQYAVLFSFLPIHSFILFFQFLSNIYIFVLISLNILDSLLISILLM